MSMRRLEVQDCEVISSNGLRGNRPTTLPRSGLVAAPRKKGKPPYALSAKPTDSRRVTGRA